MTAATYTPLAMAWLRWIVSHAECWFAVPPRAFSAGASRSPWERTGSAPAQGRQACGLGIPLIPADQHADPAVPRRKGLEAQVARGEVEFLVEERIVRNMHLAIFPEVRAVRIEHGGRIVVDSGGASLEQRHNQDNFELAGQCAEPLGRRSGNFLGKIEMGVLLFAWQK